MPALIAFITKTFLTENHEVSNGSFRRLSCCKLKEQA